MLEASQNKTYRILLTENQGKGFSELTVQEILKQILPQLAQIHASGQAHGSISLDTITQVNNTAQLAPSYTPLLANSAVMIKDISDLGRVLAELLSGQMGIQANLEDYCMVSDQTLDLVNAMMRNSITGQYRNANDVLLQLYPHSVPTQYPQTIVPTPIYTPNPTSLQYGQPTQIQQSVTPVIKRKPHTILTIIFGFIFGLGAIAIYLFIEDYLSKKPLPFISPSPVATTNNSPSVSPTPTQPQPVPIPPTVNQVQPSPIITPLPTTPSAITEEEARQVVSNWLNSKAKIFASPYDRNLAAKLSTGELYNDITKPNGSMDWLVKNNAYYTFSNQSVISKGGFTTSNDDATIDVQITESKTLYVGGQIDASQTVSSTATGRYFLKRENGTWKIRDFKLN